jgi:hypothetical protein
MTPYVDGAIGAGIMLCVTLVWRARLVGHHQLAVQRMSSGADRLVRELDRVRSALLSEQHARMLSDLTTPAAPVPSRYIVPAAPLAAATDDPVTISAVVLGHEWIQEADREARRCLAIRTEYDRNMCFDISCPQCNPRTQDRPTATITIPQEV